MNYKCFIAALGLMLYSFSTKAQDVTPDKTGMTLSATEWSKNVKMGWNLGNSLESTGGETSWGNPVTTKAMIDKVKAAGFNAIRIPVRWTNHFSDASTYTIDPAWLKRVKEVVDYCINNGMYVMINTHHEPWETNLSTSYYKEIYTIWKQVAKYFINYDDHLAFAGLNENRVGEQWERGDDNQQKIIDGYNQVFVNAVRATGGKNYYRNLIVQSYACSWVSWQRILIPEDKVDNRLSAEFHFYQPWDYAGACTYQYWGQAYKNYGSIPSMDEAEIKSIFDNIANRYIKNGYGVIIGEYGNTNHFNSDSEKECAKYYLKYVVSQMRSHGFAGFVWDNNTFGNGGEKYGIFNRNNNMSVDYPLALEAIQEGSKTNFDATVLSSSVIDKPNIGSADIDIEETTSSASDAGTAGTAVTWTGNSSLNWSSGLQLKIEGSKFTDCNENASLIITYTRSGSASDEIQFNAGDWSGKMTCTVDNSNSCDGSYKPSSTGEKTTKFTFSQLSTLKSSGMVIQGSGVTLKKVVVVYPQVTITDGKDYTPKKTSTGIANNVVLNRELKASQWNTLVLPFDATDAQLKAALGDGYKLAAINSYDGNTLGFKSASNLQANTPVIVKPAKDLKTATFEGVTVKEVSNNLTTTTSGSPSASFIGNYKGSFTLNTNAYYIDSDNGKLYKSGGSATASVTRGYFTFSDGGSAAKAFTIDGSATGIKAISSEKTNTTTIYNLAGQRVAKNYKGIVIKNGKKYLLK